MWRGGGVSWRSSDSSLPDGSHKHQPGPYFKTGPQAVQQQQQHPQQLPQQQHSGKLTCDEEPAAAANLPASEAGAELMEPSAGAAGARGRRCAPASPAEGGKFRARLSSLSAALQQPPRLAKKLLFAASSGQHQSQNPNPNQTQNQNPNQSGQAQVQITTTSIDDSPRRSAASRLHSVGGSRESASSRSGSLADGGGQLGAAAGCATGAAASRPANRRLSQLFLPQLPPSVLLQQQQHDPYAPVANELLLPPHLLDLFAGNQAPLVGPGGQPADLQHAAATGGAGQRASWADITLLGQLAAVRPSIDSAAFHQAGPARHSFDARKYQFVRVCLSVCLPVCVSL